MNKMIESSIREFRDSEQNCDLVKLFLKEIWSVDFLRETVEWLGQGPKGRLELYLNLLIDNMDRGVPYIIIGSNSIEMVCNAMNYIKYCKILDKNLKLKLFNLEMRYRYLMAYIPSKPEIINPDTLHINFLKNFPSFCGK